MEEKSPDPAKLDLFRSADLDLHCFSRASMKS